MVGKINTTYFNKLLSFNSFCSCSLMKTDLIFPKCQKQWEHNTILIIINCCSWFQIGGSFFRLAISKCCLHMLVEVCGWEDKHWLLLFILNISVESLGEAGTWWPDHCGYTLRNINIKTDAISRFALRRQHSAVDINVRERNTSSRNRNRIRVWKIENDFMRISSYTLKAIIFKCNCKMAFWNSEFWFWNDSFRFVDLNM